MAFVAMRVVKISGRRYMPGETIEVDLTTSKSLHSLLSHGYVAGYPDNVVVGPQTVAISQGNQPNGGGSDDLNLEALLEEAKALGVRVASTWKPETIAAKIAEFKSANPPADPADPADPPAGGTGDANQTPDGNQTGGDGNVLGLQRGSNEQPQG